jgi:hypothetical protein
MAAHEREYPRIAETPERDSGRQGRERVCHERHVSISGAQLYER